MCDYVRAVVAPIEQCSISNIIRSGPSRYDQKIYAYVGTAMLMIFTICYSIQQMRTQECLQMTTSGNSQTSFVEFMGSSADDATNMQSNLNVKVTLDSSESNLYTD